MEQTTWKTRPTQFPASCSHPRGSQKNGTHAQRVKEMIWPTWHSLPSSLKGLVLHLAHGDWLTRRDRCSFGSQSVPWPADVRQLQKKVLEEPSGCRATADLLGQFWGALCTQLLRGILRNLGWGRQVPCEETESHLHSVYLQVTTPAWSPVISQLHLHLGPTSWLPLENRQDKKDVLTQPFPTERSSPLQFRLNTGHYLTVMPSWRCSQENSN